jgi:hypothetical protein
LSRGGRDVVHRARVRKDAFLTTKLARLSPDELGALEAAIGAIEHMLEEEE